MINDFFLIFHWWFLLFILGLFFFPLTSFIFNNFFDKGYALSKTIAILLTSWFIWLLGSLKILPFSSQTIWLVIILLSIGNFWLLKKVKNDFINKLKDNWGIFLFEEFLFFITLALWSFVRGFQPNIQGLEKFMDYGFLNSILRSKYFPPTDMWLAGETINYYYFGHLISAFLTKLSGLDSAITYNLMIATILALTFISSFSLGANMVFIWLSDWKLKTENLLRINNWKLIIIGGLLAAFLTNLGGNFHPLWWYSKNSDFKTYWYPDATRFIVEKFGAHDNTIHEFPIYSYVVADLHGHMINIPNVVLILSLILVVSLKIFSRKKLSDLVPWLSALCFCLAIAFMTNAWDYPIYLMVAGGVIFLSNKLKAGWVEAIIKSGIYGIFLVLGSLFFSLPFQLSFKNIAQGIGLVDFHTPSWMLLVLWGLPLLNTVIFLIFLMKKKKKLPLNLIDYYALIALIISWLLIFLPEIIFVKDIYIHSHQRANTMFKLTYQSFIMFSLSSGYIAVRVLIGIRSNLSKLFFVILYSLFLTPVFIYPRFAIKSYYGLKDYRNLYGLSYLKEAYPQDYQAILWLKENVVGQPVVVEAVGESYTDYARVSANTGLPTILGWRVHEWLWRGSFDEAGKRTEEVSQIYQSPDLNLTKSLLDKYRAKYIFLGDLERQQYPQLQERKIALLSEVIFSSGTTKIYRIRD